MLSFLCLLTGRFLRVNIIQGTVASLLCENPVVQAIPLLSLWYVFYSSCTRRSMFLCNFCFQQGSECTQLIKNWFSWISIHNQCCNQELWNEETAPIHVQFLPSLSNIPLRMLDELAFLKGNSLQYQLLTFMFWRNLLKLLAYQVV